MSLRKVLLGMPIVLVILAVITQFALPGGLTAIAGGTTKPQSADGDAQAPTLHSHENGKEIWYCPMHPSIRRPGPGSCPICGMTLVRLDQGHEATPSNVDGHATVRIPQERQQLIGVRFGTAHRQHVDKTIRAVARVDYDERRLSAVNLKYGGWVEDLLVNATGQLVHKGDPLLVLYSPDLLEAERSYLLARDNATALDAQAPESAHTFARESLASARERLLLWDLTPEQLQELEEKNAPERHTTLLAKADGVVTRRNVVKGGAITPGTDLYELADLSTVWVEASVYEYEVREVQVGQPAKVMLATQPRESFEGKVTYVYPYLDEATRTVRVRLDVPNPDGRLRPGLYGNVEIAVDLGEQLVVDDQAVVDTGVRSIVFVDLGEGRFEPREVMLNGRAPGLALVAQGLKEGERIVTSGNFLIDSESRLKSALIGGSEKGVDPHAGHGGR
jgi:RND family efflux transporter MFP subunit